MTFSEATGPRWTVVGQLPTHGLDDGGRGVVGVEVTYRLASGLEDRLFVPAGEYNPDRVRALIEAAVANHEGVAGLTG